MVLDRVALRQSDENTVGAMRCNVAGCRVIDWERSREEYVFSENSEMVASESDKLVD